MEAVIFDLFGVLIRPPSPGGKQRLRARPNRMMVRARPPQQRPGQNGEHA